MTINSARERELTVQKMQAAPAFREVFRSDSAHVYVFARQPS